MHQCTMSDLMLTDNVMDNFEYQCWIQRWHESRFGSRWDHYMLGQITGVIANLMSSEPWKVESYMVISPDAKDLTEAPLADNLTDEQRVAYKMMCEFRGKDKADLWKTNMIKTNEELDGN